MKKLFDPQPGQRVWYRSADRELDIYDLFQIHERQYRDNYYNSETRFYCTIRRPGRHRGPNTWVGPGGGARLAGAP